MDEEFYEPFVCGPCIGDEFLVAEIYDINHIAECSYCNSECKVVSVDWVAEKIKNVLSDHFVLTQGYENHHNLEWHQEGDELSYIISEIGGFNEPAHDKIIEDILGILDLYDSMDEKELGEAKFSKDSYYEYAGVSSQEYMGIWAEFKKSIQVESRYFNSKAEEILGLIFSDIEDKLTSGEESIIKVIGTDDSIKKIYRAREAKCNAPSIVDSRIEDLCC